MPSPAEIAHFREHGYVVGRALYSAAEVAELRDHVDGLREVIPDLIDPGSFDQSAADPLRAWPRLIHPHKHSARVKDWLLGERNVAWAGGLLDTTPLAGQTMVYFKPPGSRGQALHQDQYFLRARPGTCLAVWLALDDCDDANGCIRVVPGSQDWDVLCPAPADPELSFTKESLPLPPGSTERPIELKAGDVLFFNGSLAHGSMPNVTQDRFRRALIAHFIEDRATSAVNWIQPVLHPDGRELWLEEIDGGGGSCGTWVEREGRPEIAMTGTMRMFEDAVTH